MKVRLTSKRFAQQRHADDHSKRQLQHMDRSIDCHIVYIIIMESINNGSPVWSTFSHIATLMFNLTMDIERWTLDNDNRTHNHCIYSNFFPFMKRFKFNLVTNALHSFSMRLESKAAKTQLNLNVKLTISVTFSD